MLKRWYIFLVFFLVSGVAFAQPHEAVTAMVKSNNSEHDSARYYIDLAITTEIGKEDAQTWTFRGYVYKAIYKAREKDDYNSASRKIAIESLTKALALDTANEYADQNRQGISYLASTYYNNAVVTLNTDQYQTSLACFEAYKDATKIIDPDFNFDSQEVQYQRVLASSVYSILYDQAPKGEAKDDWLEKAVEAYQTVLEIDSNDFSSNYNIGVLYYNLGVHKLKEIAPESDLEVVIVVQDESAELFRIALPYMQRALRLNETRLEVYNAMAGIYFSLNNILLSNYYTKIMGELTVKARNEIPEREQNFEQDLEALKKWMDENGRFPSENASTSNPTERKLGVWCYCYRMDYYRGTIRKEVVPILEAIPGWSWELTNK